MFDLLRARLAQGHRTLPFPPGPGGLPEGFRARPEIADGACPPGCEECVRACPTGAIAVEQGRMTLDLGSCLFCPECSRACPEGAVRFTREYAMATRTREDLRLRGQELALASRLEGEMLRVLGRSLKLRQVSAGGCNACESELNVLSTVAFDLARFGIQFVASPRHADGLVVTGPLTTAMREAVHAAYAAMPSPKIVLAVGACAISGGPFKGLPDVCDGFGGDLPIDLYVPGCPPHPLTLLDGLLRLLDRLS